MKTILNKKTGNIIGHAKRVLTLSAVAAIAAVPFLSATHTAQADPPRHAPAWGKHDKDRRHDRRDRRNDRRDRRRYETFTGTVTKVDSSRRFDIRADGKNYNVFLNSGTRRLDRGDVVRVYGERSGSNDIRNASVTIIRNR